MLQSLFEPCFLRLSPLTPSFSSRLGVKTRVFHLGDYRRATVGPGKDVPDDYFFVNGEDTILHQVRSMLKYLNH